MSPARPRRRLRDQVAVGWLTAAVAIGIAHRSVPAATWLMIHLVLLGALTHSALVWSEHFAHTLLRAPQDDASRRRQDIRIVLFALGALAVFLGVPGQWWWLVVTGASLVSVGVVWHGIHLVALVRRALPNRFRVVSHAYIAAAACLPVGAGFGAALAFGLPAEMHGRLLIAHIAVNLLGWIGLTVTGTLVTFWPTLLRARMDERAERLARQALPLQVGGLAVLVSGALLGWRPLALAGLLLYAAGLVWWGRALAAPLRAKGLREFAPASVLAALVWAVVGLLWVGWLLATSGTWEAVAQSLPTVAGVFAVGFAAQLLAGALSYLIPSVLGGGPSVVRAGRAWFDRGATWRLAVINAGLVLFLLPVPSWVRVTVSLLVLVALAVFLPLLIGGAKASARARRAAAAGRQAPAVAEPRLWSVGQLIAAVTAMVVAVTVGIGVDPGAAGLPLASGAAPASAVEPTGHTTRVEVSAADMRFTPGRITVPAGDRLVVVLTNRDDADSHDLVIGSARTSRLAPGASAELDAGVIGASTQGWCSVAGHRQMGMVLDIAVEGAAAAPGAEAAGHAMHGSEATGPAEAAGATIPPNRDGATSVSGAVDPVLPALSSSRVHRVTLTVTQVPLEVAPGLWQTRWTYNGRSVGPTLHGRVGDVFEITLVNDGDMGHSIDFHAGALAPDRPMRTIAPGGRLTYRFTATRAGAWMYHCSTHPMSTHIAAGMHGAVIIEPPDLPKVDRQYVLVQSEVFLANGASSAAQAQEVDADKVVAERPDRVVFNGIANQYDLSPMRARVGERVRIWGVDAGPNRPLSLHVVGGQFDTVWTEGAYTLRGDRGSGAQVLPLLPAQGGFVELTFPQPGHYPVVNHVMVDAERGAHGVVRVTR